MTDHKFTDDEIIRALECCSMSNPDCENCPYAVEGGWNCRQPEADAVDLINRQKAEIESLQAAHADMTESLRLAAEANKDMQAEIEKLKGSRNRWKQIATDFDKASRETEKEIERLTTLAELGNMRANDYREMRNKLKKANAEIESLQAAHADMTESLRLAAEANKDMQAEIERLEELATEKQNLTEQWQNKVGELLAKKQIIEAEAIKEFAKNVKKHFYQAELIEYIDSLVEEVEMGAR